MIDIKFEINGKPEYTIGDNRVVYQTIEVRQAALIDLCANIFNIVKSFQFQGFKISPNAVSNAVNKIRPSLKLSTRYRKIYEASNSNLCIL